MTYPAVAGALFAAAILVALGAPFATAARAGGAAWRSGRMRRHATRCAVIALLVGGWALKLSFVWLAANLLAVSALFVAFGGITLETLDVRPSWLGASVFLLCACGWLLAALLACVLAFALQNSLVSVTPRAGIECRETVYGFVTTDSGEDLDVYRRYGFIERWLFSARHSDVEDRELEPIPPEQAALVDTCRRLVNDARTRLPAPR